VRLPIGPALGRPKPTAPQARPIASAPAPAEARTTCGVCGQPIVQKGGRGRPRAYHKPCANLQQLLGWLPDILDEIDFRDQNARQIRAELWLIANDARVRVDTEGREQFGAAVRERRTQLGMSVAELSRRTGIDDSRIAKIVRGTRGASAAEKRTLESALGGVS
jgi:hypothetical protein